MTDSGRQLILNVNLQGFGQRPASWRTQEGITGTELTTAGFWQNLGQIAERGRLDAVFFADHPGAGNPNVRPLGLVEPFVALGAIAQATEHLGLVGSASTTYNDPVDLAERVLSLDVLTGGRLAWNAVTTYAPTVSANFGVQENPPRPERYRRAAEFTGLVKELWESAQTGERVVHRGEFFQVDALLNVPPSPQGRPGVFQAGGSPYGRDFASRHADAVFAVELNLEPAVEHYRQVKEGARAYGRRPSDVKIIPGLSLVLGSTEEEARRRFDRLESLAPDDYAITTLSTYLDEDLKGYDLDAPIPEHVLRRPVDPATFQRSVGYRETVTEWARRNNTSLRHLLRSFGGYGSRFIAGTPEQVADSIELWFRSGAADGFNLMHDEFPTGLATFVDEVVPILQRRGLFRREYRERTLRSRLRAAGGPARTGTKPSRDVLPSGDSAHAEARTGRAEEGVGARPPRFATQGIHAGQEPEGAHGARITPIYLSAGFVFEDFQEAAERFAGEREGYVYSRLNNPTNIAVEAKLSALEGGQDTVVVSSGQAATAVALLGVLQAGDHFLTAPSIYEGTRALFRVNFARLGIEAEFIEDPNDLKEWRAKLRPTTKLLFGETIPNPKNDLIDLAGIAEVAHEFGVPFVVDNTIPTPYLLRPIEHGADIVVHSASKLLTGQGAAIGGAIVDGGTFDWAAHPERFRHLSQPIGGGEERSFTEKFGSRAYYFATKTQIASRLGTSLSPFNAFLLQQGLETLSVRVRQHADNALGIARWLESRPEVESVDYSGLESNPFHRLARRYLPHGQGSVFAFTLRGGRAAAEALYNEVRLFSRMTHIGDVRSLILHPATTTHSKLSQAERDRAGIAPGLIRLSVGIEDVEDLIGDLEQAFEAAGHRLGAWFAGPASEGAGPELTGDGTPPDEEPATREPGSPSAHAGSRVIADADGTRAPGAEDAGAIADAGTEEART